MPIQQMLLGVGGGSDASYFVATLNSSNDERGNGVAVGSDGSIYVCGGGSGDIYKYDSSGVLQWQRYWDVGGSWKKIAIDSSDNVYVTNRYNQSISVLVKYNSSGVYQWNATLYNNHSSHYFQPQDVSIDSNDNIYVAGYVLDLSGTTTYKALVMKYNTVGQLEWYRIYNASGYNSMDCYGCTTDSSGNVYITGGANQSSGNYNRPYVAKINSSGSPQWCAGVIMPLNQSSGSTSVGFDVAVDNSGNAYLAGGGNQNTGNGPDHFLIKFNSSGGVVWSNFAGYSLNSDETKGVTTDSSGNIYSVGLMNQNTSGNYPTAAIFKHNSSGTLQFVRTLRNSNASYSGVYTYITAENIEIDSDNNLYIAGMTNKSTQDTSSPSDEVVVVKLPGDGSLTGTYGSFTYADASSYAHSNNINTLGTASYSLTDNSSTYSPSTGSLSRTEGATSLTSVTTLFNAIGGGGGGPAAPGQQEYTTPGTYTWTCPAGVTSVSVVCIGGGGTGGAYGGSGGSLAYKNNITVTPGQTYTIIVGNTNSQVSGSPYSFTAESSSAFNCVASGGEGGYSGSAAGSFKSIGSGYDGGGRGGLASGDFYQSGIGYKEGAGGGAGGYSGDGGNAGKGDCSGSTSISDYKRAPTAGSGGGGGGGTPGSSTSNGGGGGGTGIYGQGSNGAAGSYPSSQFGQGGSGGANGTDPYGGQYGGGSAGQSGSTTPNMSAQHGAVRFIWPGDQRQFPSTRTADE
tara:strand:+ start:1315 stop:3522 length:2208 start_codon:yes stop_codon:yes gene_type:complete